MTGHPTTKQTVEVKDGKGALAWVLDVLKALLPGVVLALIGFALNDTVNEALKEHELQIDAIKDLQSLSEQLQKASITRDEALAKAAQLASYGKYSVPFFINVQEIGNEYGVQAATEGLRMVARSEPDAVCGQVASVIRNRTGLYHWQSHLAALQLIGAIRCADTTADVKAYQTDLSSLAVLTTWVAAPAPEQAELEKILGELKTTIDRLNRPAPPAPAKHWFCRGR
jgi:hypothetical protein